MTYSSSVSGRVRAIIGGLVITLVLAVAAPFLLHEAGVSRVHSDLLAAVAIAVAVIGAAWTLVHALVTGPVTVRTSPTHVEVTRGRKVRENWARADTAFSSFIVRQSTNGIQTGTTRKLIAHTATEQVEVVLPWFGAETYNALIADVAPLVDPAQPPAAVTAQRAATGGTFAIDRSSKKLTARLVAIGIAIAVLAAVTVSIAWELDGSAPTIAITLIGAVLVFAAIAIPLLRQERRIPRALAVSQSSLQFDDRVFPVGQLSAIRATPPGYTDQRRTIDLTDTTGKRTRIPLGHANDKSFAAYGEYLEAIRLSTAHRPGIFTLAVA